MANPIAEILKYLKESEKDMLISQSGSTKDSSMEKIRSGQSYLYKKRGMESEVIEIRFFQNVSGPALTNALNKTMIRYPYFNTKLIEKDGDFYIVQNDMAPLVRRSKKIAKLGGMEVGYHLIDVSYHEKSVFVSFHHALCDGKGIKPFVETLIWYYCFEKYRNREKVEGIRYSGDPLLENETADPFMHKYEYDENREYISLNRDAFALPEESVNEGNFRFEITVDHDAFMKVCRVNNATPSILLALLMNKAIGVMYPDRDKDINANIVGDMRSSLGYENTFKNCVSTMIFPYGREFQEKPLKEQAAEYRELLAAQRDSDYCKRSVNAMIGLSDRLDSLNGYEEKQKIMSFFEGMELNTYVISYLGEFVLGKNASHISGIYLYNSGATGLGINMISVGDRFDIVFKQSFSSDVYTQAFCYELKNVGLASSYSGAIPFETPVDKVINHDN